MPATMVYLTVACLACAQIDTSPAREGIDSLSAALTNLGADSYDVRQAAMEQLWAAGEAAIPALESAVQGTSAEARARAQFVLDYLRMGVAHDTPKTILREIQRFRTGTVDERRRAIRFLESAGRPRILLALLQSETTPRLRVEWNQALERSVVQAIAAGNLDEVAATLQRAADSDSWTRHYAAFFAQRGQADDELLRLAGLPPGSGTALLRRRAALLRATGNLGEAIPAVEQVAPALALPLLLEHGDWESAARSLATSVEAGMPGSGTDVEPLGLAAACFRLAGQPDREEHFVRMLNVLAEEIAASLRGAPGDKQTPAASPPPRREMVTRQWHVAKALLLLGRHDDALQLVRRDQTSFVFELLCEQHRYREAFALAGVDYPQGFQAEWFRKVAEESAAMGDTIESGFTIAQIALRHLWFLGEREELRSNFQILAQSAQNDRDTRRLRMLCDTAIKLSWRDEARDLASVILLREDRPAILGVLYPNRSGTANLWWDVFRGRHADEPPTTTLERIDTLLQPASPGEAEALLDRWLSEAADRAATLPAAKQLEWWHELAETCLLHGRRDEALGWFSQAGQRSAADAVKAGDLWAAAKKWDLAADWYGRAWNLDPARPLPLYLKGRVVRESGRRLEGERLMQLASLMPLANEEPRQDLATGLKERGFRDEALEQFEWLMQTGEPQSSRLVDAAKQAGNLVYPRDELRAAACWQAMLLCCLKPTWGFVESNGYVQIPFLVHKTRAKGLLKADRVADALRELEFSRQALPGNTELAEELVPLLQSAGQPAAADRLLITSAAAIRDLLSDFPRSPTLHNNLAWLLARCDRDLDDALAHSRQALELEPNKPSFLDTLGEVHFRRGQWDEAIACAQRCLQLEPRSSHFQAQLARFRKARGTPGP